MLLFFHLPTLTTTILIALIAILTLSGIMIRPFKWNEAMIAMSGAGLLYSAQSPTWNYDIRVMLSRKA